MGFADAGIAIAFWTGMANNNLSIIPTDDLALACGGAGSASRSTSQAELRALAKDYCPAVYQRYRNAPTITRPMAEKCLDEAGYGAWKGYLDRYFPKTK